MKLTRQIQDLFGHELPRMLLEMECEFRRQMEQGAMAVVQKAFTPEDLKAFHVETVFEPRDWADGQTPPSERQLLIDNWEKQAVHSDELAEALRGQGHVTRAAVAAERAFTIRQIVKQIKDFPRAI